MASKSLLLCLLLGSAAAARVNSRQNWEEYKVKFGKGYGGNSTEEAHRMGVFFANLDIIDRQNSDPEDTATYGVNYFTDLTPAEFREKYLMPHYQNPMNASSDDESLEESLEIGKGAFKKDWAGILTTPVKNQAQCGSCWAFSATEQIESDTMRTLKKTFILSPQQIVSCDKVDLGCNGGNTETAYQYVEKAGGIVLASAYPYTSKGGNTVSYAAYCVDASSWQNYRSGIMKKCGKQLDHCVQAVGINTAGGYWKVRNSWATSWGEDGYIRLAYGRNTCGLTHDPTWVSVKLV